MYLTVAGSTVNAENLFLHNADYKLDKYKLANLQVLIILI